MCSSVQVGRPSGAEVAEVRTKRRQPKRSRDVHMLGRPRGWRFIEARILLSADSGAEDEEVGWRMKEWIVLEV